MDTHPGMDAVNAASDLCKQLVVLATGILTLTITFTKEVVHDSPRARRLIAVAWVGYLASILCGIWELMAITGTLEPTAGVHPDPSIRGLNVVLPSILQITAFAVSTLLVVAFGIHSLRFRQHECHWFCRHLHARPRPARMTEAKRHRERRLRFSVSAVRNATRVGSRVRVGAAAATTHEHVAWDSVEHESSNRPGRADHHSRCSARSVYADDGNGRGSLGHSGLTQGLGARDRSIPRRPIYRELE